MLRHKAPLIVGTLLILGMIAYVTLYRSSPGILARGHQAVAGSPMITDCKKCHAAKGLTWGCLQCHTEIQEQLTRHRGYHDYLASHKKSECAPCHSDHNGLDFQMTNKASWEGKDPKDFKHPQADYHLTGKHVPLDCDKCHSAKIVRPFSLPKFKKYIRAKTYFGLTQDCLSCHEDVHARGFASQCAQCHGQLAWKPTTPLFNHDKFFTLKGGHANLKCKVCHPIPTSRPVRYDVKKFPFDKVTGTKCMDCHKNPHRTKWVESCESCHRADDKTWSLANDRMTKTQHAMTGFRLALPHNKTTCLACHGPNRAGVPFKVKYPNPREPGYNRFEKACEGCHKDEHRGQFTKTHARCIDCHTRTAFMPAAYGVKDHKTYPLTGGHIKAACNLCHIKDGGTKVRQYVPTGQLCRDCHKDMHYGQFRQDTGKTRCEDCHRSVAAWNKVVFDHNQQSRFKLDLAHAKVACKDCHPWVTVKGVRLVQYKPLRMQCRDCHDFDH